MWGLAEVCGAPGHARISGSLEARPNGLADRPARAEESTSEVDLETAEITATFLVGGFAELIATLLADTNRYRRDTVIDRCTDLFLTARETALTAARK
ncbi:hypothetical protein JMUB6875_76580 [Nocardia sp. JMUB6875]|uniref:hypothetical protein n=1 Tax=Nocardia sp. JMUB6875 TaxID=3158170 RepID=UPI0032E5C670